MASLASLVVDLQVQNAELRRGLDEASAKIDSFAKKAEGAGRALSAVFNVAVLQKAFSAVSRLVTSGAEAADAMGKMAQAAGAPVAEFSKLAYAADFSGVSATELSSAMQKLGKNIAEASTGKNKEAAAVFQALGVSVKDAAGKLRSSDQVMGDLAEKFSKLEDGAAKTAIAQELLGKSGAALIPLLNGGKEGLIAMAKEAESLGLVIGEQAFRSAEEFNDSLGRLQKIGAGLAVQVSAALSPALKKLSDDVLAAAQNSGVLSGAVTVIKTAFQGLLSGLAYVIAAFNVWGKAIGAVGAAAALALEGDFRGAKEALKEFGGDVVAEGKALVDKWKGIWTSTEEPIKQQEQVARQSADGIVAAARRVEEAEKRKAAAVKQAAEDMRDAYQSTLNIAKVGASADDQAADLRRTMAFTQAGVSGPDVRGFADFEQALKVFTDSTVQAAAQTELARAFEKAGVYDAARGAHELADELTRNAANAKTAANAFVEVEKASRAAAEASRKEAAQRMEAMEAASRQAAANMGMKLAGSNIGGLISSGVEGAQMGMVAGPQGAAIGAVAGVAIQLLTQSKQFASIMETVDGIIQGLADGLGALLEPISLLLEPLEPLGLVFGMVAKMMAAYLRPGIELLALVLKVVSSIILTVAGAIGKVWNAIIGAIQSVFSTIGKFEFAGQKPFKFFDDWSKSLEQSKVNVLALEDAQRALWEEQREALETVPPPAGEAGRALQAMADTAAEAQEQFSESVTNAAEGFKVQRARFGAATPELLSPTLAAQIGQAAPVVNVTNNITLDGQQIASSVETRTEYNQQVTTGLPVPPASRYLGYGGYGGIPGALPGGNY